MASKINVDKIARNSGTPEFTIPTADGAANTVLQTDGSGVLSFTPNVINSSNVTYTGNSVLDIKNAGTASSIKVYCESSNAHYTEIKSGPHASATSYTITLPNKPPTVSGQVLSATTAGVASWATASDVSGLASVQVFTSSGTWTRPAGITKVIMEVQGAGGGGCKGSSYHQGGAGGGYAKKLLDVSSISTSTITVGSGGAGAAAGVTANGTAGGNSSWADGTNTITGNGGAGGTDANAYTAGGTGTGGDVNIPGQINGQNPNQSGDSVLGYGGTAALNSDSPVGAKSGQGYGGGGSAWSGYSVACGSGSGGIVIVWEYK